MLNGRDCTDDGESVVALRARVAELLDRVDRDAVEIATLRQALDTARRIGAAVGIVMADTRLTEDEAFDVLRRASQNTNRKLRDIADDVVRTGLVPAERTSRSLTA